MIVLIKRNSATSTPVDVGEGDAAKLKIRQLQQEHGHTCVTDTNGKELGIVPDPSEPVPTPPANKAKKPKAKAKKAAKKSKRK